MRVQSNDLQQESFAQSALRGREARSERWWLRENAKARTTKPSKSAIFAVGPEILRTVTVFAVFALLSSGCKDNGDDAVVYVGGVGGGGGSGGVTSTTTTPRVVLPEPVEQPCLVAAGSEASTEYLSDIGCRTDFNTLASQPLTSSIPGASSGKVVFDRGPAQLYFQNSNIYPIHFEFATAHLSASKGFTDVGALPAFNSTEYSSDDRRFVLGAVTYYDGPKAWTLELSPYDRATATMISDLFSAVKAHAYFGSALYFHPTSDQLATTAKALPAEIPIITTDEIYSGIDYQPLNLGETVGQVNFVAKTALATEYVGFRDIVVLEAIPNDIAVTSGLITGEFQTPLSHINVLARNRGTPNMGLRNAFTNETLKALDGKWAKLTVSAFGWTIVEVTKEEADAWWEENKPDPVKLPDINLEVKDLRDIKTVTVESVDMSLLDSISNATLAFGAKAANYSVLSNTPDVPIRPAFAIPIYYYHQFMQENGFFDQVRALIADSEFQNSLAVQDKKLAALRDAMIQAPLNAAFMQLVKDKFTTEYPGLSMRFRTSTNAEDLAGFPCAGCYDSHTGDPNKSWDDVWEAIKETWAGVWFYRTFREREFHSIDHTSVGMALLVHHNFPEEEANGVAVTANIYEPTGIDPALYVNVQYGGQYEVVAPPPGVTSDAFLYYFTQENQPTAFLSHSNVLPAGTTTVLTRAQTFALGKALTAIHERFSPAFGPASGKTGWYAMDVEFKFDDEDNPGTPSLIIKQARPYPDPSK